MLTRSSRNASDDRGAVAILVSLLIAFVMLGLGALAVDAGQFYAEKGQLQNGADAAAIAVAETCAKGTCDTGTSGTSAAGTYANKNANDNLSTVEQLCGSITSGCPAASNLCPGHGAAPASGGNWVDVQTETLRPDGTHLLPTFFSKAVLEAKNPGYDGTTIHACAQAQWGQPGGGVGLAMTMSVCDWKADTASATVGDPNAKYANPEPPYPANPWPPAYGAKVDNKTAAVPKPGGENVVQITGVGKCGAGQSGNNVPGGVGWLSDQANGQTPANCMVTTNANGYVYSSGGGIGGRSGVCGNALQAMYDASKGPVIPNSLNPIVIPVFDLQCGSDGKIQPDDKVACPTGMPPSSYHILGYAQFVLTGFDANPYSNKSLINAANPCNGNSFQCLYGMFTDKLLPAPPGQSICDPTKGPCPALGPPIVQLTG
jgi:hypothetical protein